MAREQCGNITNPFRETALFTHLFKSVDIIISKCDKFEIVSQQSAINEKKTAIQVLRFKQKHFSVCRQNSPDSE